MTRHTDLCPKVMVNCPMGCGATFKRENWIGHTQTCGLVPVQCPMKRFGCKASGILRKDLKAHLEANAIEHFNIATFRLAHVERKLDVCMNRMGQIFGDMDENDRDGNRDDRIILHLRDLCGVREQSYLVSSTAEDAFVRLVRRHQAITGRRVRLHVNGKPIKPGQSPKQIGLISGDWLYGDVICDTE